MTPPPAQASWGSYPVTQSLRRLGTGRDYAIHHGTADSNLTGRRPFAHRDWRNRYSRLGWKAIEVYDPRQTSEHVYFSASHFSLQPLGTFGTANRRLFPWPWLDNWDVALRKYVRVQERYSLELRGKLFNALNHTQFNNPNGNSSSASFGWISSARDPRIDQLALRFSF